MRSVAAWGLGGMRRLWAGPGTLLGLLLLVLTRATGGVVRGREGTLEAHGGALARVLPGFGRSSRRVEALALGHVILARDPQALDRWRAHERIHVRQWERWGPLFLPAYGARSLWAWLNGRDPYRANGFEREAWGDPPALARDDAEEERVPGAGHVDPPAA